jgi:threonine dehydratase
MKAARWQLKSSPSGIGPMNSGTVHTLATETPTLDRAGISAALQLIRPYVRLTPVIELDGSDFGLAPAPRLSLKLELFQHTGSFKPRGAFTSLLSRPVPQAGVVAASGGNHGAAVAYAAKQLGIPAKIFVPTVASSAKVQLIRDSGADVVRWRSLCRRARRE